MKIKYPRTYHVEWSPGKTSDDKTQFDLSSFEGKYIVLTEKMDGENSTISREYTHARSLDSNNHPSRDWLKGMWGNMRYNIPEGWRICGENLYAKHSIHYKELPSYFMVFSIWNEKNECLSIKDTLEWCELLELEFVPILHQGIFNLEFIKNFKINTEKQEGFVMRLAKSFHYDEFNKSVIKYVRKSHVQTTNHWMNEKIVKNILR